MIIVFPLLTDESISPNVIPGLCKTIENYLLIYQMDAISKMIGQKVLAIGTVTSKFLISAAAKEKPQTESMFLIEDTPNAYDPSKAKLKTPQELEKKRLENEKWEEQKKKNYEDWKRDADREKHDVDMKKAKNQEPRDRVKFTFDVLKGLKDVGTIDIKTMDSNSISLEPTYAQVTTSSGTKIIGIKVIPTRVKCPKGVSLAEMMTADLSLDFWQSKIVKIKRKIIRGFWAACRGIRLVPFLSAKSRGVITGNPEKDILLASTFHRKFVYCLLNYDNMKDSEFFRNAGGIHKLHSLGWTSIIAADDVNKRVIWCMKEFHGLCSSTPYSFIYSSLGRDQAQTYTDLENVRKTASSIFGKSKISIKKLFGESKSVVDDYLKRIK